MYKNNEVNINWNKFKIEAKGKHLDNARSAYIELCELLDEVDFELVGDYVGALEKVELRYKFDNNIKLNMSPRDFKQCTYKRIINFKNKLKENGDIFIKFVGLTERNVLISTIKTFNNGKVDLDISKYDLFNKSRKDFYDKLKEINGYTKDFYVDNKTKMNIYIDDAKLNSMSVNSFKNSTYKAIVNFKNNLKKNNDEFIKFIRITEDGNLIAQIKTFDGGEIEIDIASYNRFSKARQNTYNYCKEKGYKILNPYVGGYIKILIDFNCGHEAHWIKPDNLKQNKGCPVCSESKGEKSIREYLENNKIDFVQEYKFEGCRHKRCLPFDFYIPSKNLCVEFDGEQHFIKKDFFGGEESFKDTQIRDKIKSKFCKDNGINLLRIPYWELDNIEKILDEVVN